MTLVPLSSQPGACGWCSTPWSVVFHGGPCPQIKAIEYHPNGTIARVEHADSAPAVWPEPQAVDLLARRARSLSSTPEKGPDLYRDTVDYLRASGCDPHRAGLVGWPERPA